MHIGDRLSDVSSKPGRCCLSFIFALMLLRNACIYVLSFSYGKVVGQIEYYYLDIATSQEEIKL